MNLYVPEWKWVIDNIWFELDIVKIGCALFHWNGINWALPFTSAAFQCANQDISDDIQPMQMSIYEELLYAERNQFVFINWEM